MSKADDISYIETVIGNCGTSDSLAETAKKLLNMAEYLDNKNVRDAYVLVRSEVILYSGLTKPFSINFLLIDEVIQNY